MIKNKDGSFNKFNLSIIILISIISICMIGSIILSSVDIPKINLFEENSKPIITPDVTIIPTPESSILYDTNWSWSDPNYTTNTTLCYAGGGGSGSWAYLNNTNTTLVYVVGSGGVGGTASISHPNTTYSSYPVNETWTNKTSTPSSTIENVNITESVVTIMGVYTQSNIFMVLVFLFPLIFLSMMFSNSSSFTGLIMVIMVLLFGMYIFNIPITPITCMPLIFIGMFVIIQSILKIRDDY